MNGRQQSLIGVLKIRNMGGEHVAKKVGDNSRMIGVTKRMTW